MVEEETPIEEEVPQQASPEAVDVQEVPGEEGELEQVDETPIEVEKVSKLREIPLDQLIPHREQGTGIRNEDIFEKLKADIETHGLNQPILVRQIGEKEYEIVAGQNRWEAVKQLGKSKTIEAMVKEMGDDESAERALTDNLHIQGLPPYWLECSIAKRYKNGNYTHQKLGDALGISETWVRDNIKAHEIRRKIAEKPDGDFFTEISTSAILESNKITDYGRDLHDLVRFLEIARKGNYGASKIGKMVENMKQWSPEGWNDFLYIDKPKSFEKVNDAEKRKRNQNSGQQKESNAKENETKEEPEEQDENKIIRSYGAINKAVSNDDLNTYLESLDDEEQGKSIRHIKLTIVLLSEVLVKQKYITAIHLRQIADDIFNCKINPHDYDGTSDLEVSGPSYAEKLESAVTADIDPPKSDEGENQSPSNKVILED